MSDESVPAADPSDQISIRVVIDDARLKDEVVKEEVFTTAGLNSRLPMAETFVHQILTNKTRTAVEQWIAQVRTQMTDG